MRWLFVTEYREGGGGYTAISGGLSLGLDHLGEEVKILAINYSGFQHPLPVSIIPMHSLELLPAQLEGIIKGWNPDNIIVLFDLPHHVDFVKSLKCDTFKYVGIFPVEGAPIKTDWASAAMEMDYAFTLSDFGLRACADAGIYAQRLPLTSTPGILPAKDEDKPKMREKLLLGNCRVILKVADNHSRKNWSHTIPFFARWHKPGDVLYAVTRPENGYGWDLTDLCVQNGAEKIPGTTTICEWPDGAQIRIAGGVPIHDLSWLFNICDCLLMDAGNEGAGMPIFEAFHLGLPVVGMNHTAITEALDEQRGILFDPGYEYIDPFGNASRWYPDYESWSDGLNCLFAMDASEKGAMLKRALEWVHRHTWVDSARALIDVLATGNYA